MYVFDRDGTLYNYNYGWYTDKEHPWTDPETHVFLKDTLFSGMATLFNHLGYTGDVCIISKLPENLPSATLDNMVLDKLKHFVDDGFTIWNNNIHFTKLDKTAYFKKITGRLPNKDDFLFSDYQPELESWELIGGTAIKVLNGVNSINRWNGFYIHAEGSGAELIQAIADIKSKIKNLDKEV